MSIAFSQPERRGPRQPLPPNVTSVREERPEYGSAQNALWLQCGIELIEQSRQWFDQPRCCIGESLAALLLDCLQAELVCVEISATDHEPSVRRTAARRAAGEDNHSAALLAAWPDTATRAGQPHVTVWQATVGEQGRFSLATVPLEADGKCGRVLVAARRSSFPDSQEEQFLWLTARQAALVLQRGARESALRRQLQQRIEALAEAERRKDDLLAMLAHELRNPLAPIRNGVEVLRLTDLPADAVEVCEIIDRQVQHLAELVNDLVDVSRLARGKLLLQRREVDLAALARHVAEAQQPQFQAAGVRLELDLPNQPVHVHGDADRLGQVVKHLLHNARKFTPSGGRVCVCVSTAAGDTGPEAILVVQDTGLGMRPEVLRRVFEPFSQAPRRLDRSPGGMGMGGALVRGLVELHGGRVEAASQGPGTGSSFVVRLPRHTPAAPGTSSHTRRPTPAAARRVLIVDDRRDTLLTLGALVEKAGWQAAVAHNGRQALEEAARFQPEVILCDLHLPGDLDGCDVARQLRNSPAFARVKMVAISGNDRPSDRRRALQAGFDDYRVKPLGAAELYALLDESAA